MIEVIFYCQMKCTVMMWSVLKACGITNTSVFIHYFGLPFQITTEHKVLCPVLLKIECLYIVWLCRTCNLTHTYSHTHPYTLTHMYIYVRLNIWSSNIKFCSQLHISASPATSNILVWFPRYQMANLIRVSWTLIVITIMTLALTTLANISKIRIIKSYIIVQKYFWM
jgi:hypothetical protein